jgi:hypothetical protein
MPIVLIPVAWLAVLIVMIAICRAAARADVAAEAAAAAERHEVLAGVGTAALREAEAEPPAYELASMGSGLAPQGRFVPGRTAAGRGRSGDCARRA